MNKIILKCQNGIYFLNNKQLTLEKSLKVRNHSPDGFSHGYAGSGPSQLALAVMLEIQNDANIAQRQYHNFKNQHIATLSHGDFEITIDVAKYLQ